MKLTVYVANPPLEESETTTIWNSAIKYFENNINSGHRNGALSFNLISCNQVKESCYSSIEDRETDHPNKDEVIEQATEIILSKHHFITVEESKEILVYQNGVYVRGGDTLIDKLAEKILGYVLKNQMLLEIKGHIMRSTYKSSIDIDADINIINLGNGLYNIAKDELKPHSPEYPSINQKPIFFDPNQKTTLFGKFLKDVLYPSEIRTAIEVVAYTF